MTTLQEQGGWRSVFTTLMANGDLPAAQARAAMAEILTGAATPAQIGAFIIALRMKGEAVDEVTGMVEAMLDAAAPIELPAGVDAVDIVGTGGSPSRRAHALNVSTMACFVVAGAGVAVCKHGNRKATSTSGSSDLLEALGIAVELDGPAVARCVVEAGVGFCFARAFHSAMRHAGPVRAELGVPTVFNFLGPLSNPARVRRQVIGVSDLGVAPTIIGVLERRQMLRAMVVHGHDGLDELSLTGPTTVLEWRDGAVRRFDLCPADLGLTTVAPAAVEGGDEHRNAEIAHRVLNGEPGAYRDIVLLNAAAGLVVGGAADAMADAIDLARSSIDDGRAAAALAALVVTSNR